MSSYSEKMADREVFPHDNYEDENQVQEFFKFVREYFEVDQKWDEVQQFGVEHPVVSLFLIVTMATCALPLVIFGSFVVGSLVVALSGFLFFEGTMIAIATMVLGGALFFAALFALGISVFLVAGYQLVMLAGNLLGKVKGYVPSVDMAGDKMQMAGFRRKQQ